MEKKSLEYIPEEILAKISDLGLAASLRSIGFEFLGVDRTDPTRVVFLFKKNPALGEAVDFYFRGVLQVDALALITSLKVFKNLLFLNHDA